MSRKHEEYQDYKDNEEDDPWNEGYPEDDFFDDEEGHYQ